MKVGWNDRKILKIVKKNIKNYGKLLKNYKKLLEIIKITRKCEKLQKNY